MYCSISNCIKTTMLKRNRPISLRVHLSISFAKIISHRYLSAPAQHPTQNRSQATAAMSSRRVLLALFQPLQPHDRTKTIALKSLTRRRLQQPVVKRLGFQWQIHKINESAPACVRVCSAAHHQVNFPTEFIPETINYYMMTSS